MRISTLACFLCVVTFCAAGQNAREGGNAQDLATLAKFAGSGRGGENTQREFASPSPPSGWHDKPFSFFGTEDDSTAKTGESSVRAEAGLYMGMGVLMEGISITTHNSIPYCGVGHFLQEEWLTGTFYLGTEVGLPLLEKHFRDKAGASDWQKYPSFSNPIMYTKTAGLSQESYANKLYADLAHHSEFYVRLIDFYDAYRGFHERTSSQNKVVPKDESVSSLLASPFKPTHLTNPWVFGPALVALAAGYFDSRSDKPLSSAQDVSMFDSKFSTASAAFTHGGVDAYRYMMVAAGEEMFFRGALQTELTERTHPTIALVLTSVIFGAWHLPNNSIGSALAATVGGAYLGYRYQANGYNLGEVIATHFWLDFMVSVVEFVQNPRNGRFVYSIRWRM